MENNISRSTIASELYEVREASSEPYVGMPVYLDDSFFKFVSGDIELDCMPEDDMMPDNWPMMPDHGEKPNPEKPGNGGNMPGNGDNMPDNGMQKPMDCVMNCPLAMAYVPWQGWEETYEPEKGFMVGTMFPCLDLPFLGGTVK